MEMGFEMQERARSLWPHLNGSVNVNHNLANEQQTSAPPPPAATAQHNLPPIACRPSTSIALKADSAPASSMPTRDRMSAHAFTPPLHPPHITASSPSPKPLINNSPCPSPSSPSPRERRSEHVFTLPNPPRPLHPTTRAPTPFPELHSQHPHAFHLMPPGPEPAPPDATLDQPATPLSNSSPVHFSVPSQSAFATVPRPQPLRFHAPQPAENSNVSESKGNDIRRSPSRDHIALPLAPNHISSGPVPCAELRQPPPGGTSTPTNPEEKNIESTPSIKENVHVLPLNSTGNISTHSLVSPEIPTNTSANAILPPVGNDAVVPNERFATFPTQVDNQPDHARINAPFIVNPSQNPVTSMHNQNNSGNPSASSIENQILNRIDKSPRPSSKSPLPSAGSPREPLDSFRLTDEFNEKAHQHLTSDGRKSYSNQNRRYLATPVVGIEPTPSEPHALPSLPDPFDMAKSSSSLRIANAKTSHSPGIFPQTSISSSGVPPNARYPDNTYNPSDFARSFPRAGGVPPTNELMVNVSRQHNSPYMRPSANTPSPNPNRQYPDPARQFPNQSETKQYLHNPSSQDQLRSSSQTSPYLRGESSQFPPHYRNINPQHTPSMLSPQMPERIKSQGAHQPAELRQYQQSNHERVPHSSHPYQPPRDIVHSAHSERPLAFNVTTTRANEPPRMLRPPHAIADYNQARIYPPSHPQKHFEARPPVNPNQTRLENNPSNRHPDPARHERARNMPTPHQDKTYPAHSAFGLNDFARSFQQHGDKESYNFHQNAMPKGYPPNAIPPPQSSGNAKYQVAPHAGYPAYSSASELSMVPTGHKKGEIQNNPQHPSRDNYLSGRMPINQQVPHYQHPALARTHSRSEVEKNMFQPTNNRPNEPMFAKSMPRLSEPIKQVQLPQDLAQLHRTQSNYPPVSQTPASPRERPQHHPITVPPGGAQLTPVSVSSSLSPRVSTSSYQSSPHSFPPRPSYSKVPSQYSQNDPHPYPANRSLPTSVSSSSSPNLPRVNFAPGQAAFSGASHTDSHASYMPSNSGINPAPSGSHHQRLPGFHDSAKNQPTMQPQNMAAQGRLYPYSANQSYPYQHQSTGQGPSITHGHTARHPSLKDPPNTRPTSSPYAPSRGHAMENDTCCNPFELPTPSSMRAAPPNNAPQTVIKSHYTTPHAGAIEAKPVGYPQRPIDSYPTRTDHAKPNNNSEVNPRYPMPNARTHQRSVSGSDDRQKPPQLSARFPPVPQSNFDLQRQIHERMSGLHQAPPRLLEKARAMEKQPPAPNPEGPSLPYRLKRESPLDLSVKTVRQSADSTKNDVDLYAAKYQHLASAPKIDFNPNFAGGLVQPEAQPLPPVQSICKFQNSPNQVMGHMQDTAFIRKRAAEERTPTIPPKIPKVDTWKLAMDEKIEERLKAARQSRYPAAPLTPLHPPAQSVTPTNPEVLQPPARPNQDLYAHSHLATNESIKPGRGWSSGVFLPPTRPPDPDSIVQQISQGVLPPDTRILQDHSVVDKIRSSLEEKEARLQALQAAARKNRQTLPPFDALSAERMRTPPSYLHPPPRGAEPVPIGIEANRKLLQLNTPPRAQDPDLDGLAAFLAARIRTKAEMKQMGPTESFRSPENHGLKSNMSGASPPKGIREGRLSQGSQGSRRLLVSPCSEDSVSSARPRDPSGIRSSSETSVFDFRESDSEGEGHGMEKPIRRPRKTLPQANEQTAVDKNDAEPDPMPAPTASTHEELIKPDPAWDEVCDLFVEQLRTRPIKRSVRKKKPNPKFFTNELETPQFLKVKAEQDQMVSDKNDASASTDPPKNAIVKVETERVDFVGNKPTPPLPAVKDESSSDDDMPGVTVIKQGRVKILTRKQRRQASDSEWGSSIDNSSSSSGSDSSSESESESEDSSARKKIKRSRVRDSSDSDHNTKKKKGRIRTRNQVASDSDESDDSGVEKRRRTRKVASSDSEDSEDKASGRRTRSRPLSDSEEEVKRKSKKQAVSDSRQTRQQARTAAPARMKLRSKKRSSAKGSRVGVDDDIVIFKKKLRIPDKLICSSKMKKSKMVDSAEGNQEKSNIKSEKKSKTEKKASPEKAETKNKKEQQKCENDASDSGESTATKSERVGSRGKTDMMQKRSMRGSVGMRRSNKAVQNSKRHLNKSKRTKIRKKFRSGLDFIRKNKKKPAKIKEGRETPTITEHKRRDRSEITDISAEVKSWVVNKSAGETLLHRAARLGYNEVVAYCLDSLRMPPSTKDNAGYTPLHEACIRGHVAVAETLLQYGASVSESAPGGIRPLHQASENNHIEMVRLLLSYGADPMLTTYTGQTGLSLATSDPVRNLILQHKTEVIADEPPKWHFDAQPASVYDAKWTADVLSEPPSPSPSPFEIEVEESLAMLPPLYRLSAAEGEMFDPQERWVLLADVAAHLKAATGEAITDKLPNTVRREMADKVFVDRASACNILSSVKPTGRKVTLLRYDDAMRRLLDVQVTTITHIDR